MQKKDTNNKNNSHSILDTYYAELKNFPPITKEEERILLKKYKENHDTIARQRLITSNLRYALKYVINYNKTKNIPIEDLISEANIGLIEAVDKFEIGNDNRIVTYANWRMLYNMQEAEKQEKYNITEEYELNKLHDDEYENDANFYERDDLYEGVAKTYDRIDDDSENETAENKYIKDVISTLVSELSKREYNMICMYYGINGEKESTLAEIGKKNNITKERVRQIIEKSKRKMRIKALVENKICYL